MGIHAFMNPQISFPEQGYFPLAVSSRQPNIVWRGCRVRRLHPCDRESVCVLGKVEVPSTCTSRRACRKKTTWWSMNSLAGMHTHRCLPQSDASRILYGVPWSLFACTPWLYTSMICMVCFIVGRFQQQKQTVRNHQHQTSSYASWKLLFWMGHMNIEPKRCGYRVHKMAIKLITQFYRCDII